MKNTPSPIVWIVAGIVFLALAAGAVYLGLSTERAVGGKVLSMLPKGITAKWGQVKAAPTPTPTESVAKEEPTPARMHTPADTKEPTPPPDEPEVSASLFILPFSDTKKVIGEDLIELSPWELKVARNEIYARHGRPFVSKDLSCYFARQSWYTEDAAYTDARLSPLETANAVFILNYEKATNSPLVNKDSGCK
jgi:hypothetical protein